MQDKFDALEAELRNNCDPHHWYTHLLLLRLQEDRLLARKPALFSTWNAHIARYMAPLLVVSAFFLVALWRSRAAGLNLNPALATLCVGLYAIAAHLDWTKLCRTRQALRLPARWEEYPGTMATAHHDGPYAHVRTF